MPRFPLIGAAAVAIALSFPPGCGSEDPTFPDPPDDEQEDGGDGKVHPPGDGMHTTETAACQDLLDAQEARIKALSCSITTRTCPSLLRVVFTTACLEYDSGSVQGCIDYYKSQNTCEDLAKSFADCVVTPFTGTEPAGCP